MEFTKQTISKLHLCYSLAELTWRGEHCFLAAAEQDDPCYLFSEDGKHIATPWTRPGGVMSMQAVPGRDGEFLAIRRFYSPDDSKQAEIVWCAPDGAGGWKVHTLVPAPFAHRFGILERNGVRYLLICCLKSGHEYPDDWRFPGAVFAAVLPEDLSLCSEQNPLPIRKLKDGMLKNHGYCCCPMDGRDQALVTCEEGVYLFTPPENAEAAWEIRCLLETPASDAVLCDFDGDGQPELGVIEHFHGDTLSIFHLNAEGRYEKCWEYPSKLEMLHAIWAGDLGGKKRFVAGNRKGTRRTLMITWKNDAYREELLEADAGAANVLHFRNRKGQDVLVAANRETDEVTMFTFEG